MSLITCHSIRKVFGARVLFENVSLTIAASERVGLIGPNGSGKTTLMQILAGVETPDSGIVTYRKSLRVGYVTQENAFGENDTVRSVAESALERGVHEDIERGARINLTLGKSGFKDLDQPAQSLSGGWRKRLA